MRLGLGEFDLRLLETLDCPTDLRGSVLAVRRAVQCIRAAATLHPTTLHLQAWLDHVQGTATRLANAASDHPELMVLGGTQEHSRAWLAFARPQQSNLHSSKATAVNGAIGCIVVKAMVEGHTVPAASTTAWLRLLQCGSARASRHPDWESIVQDFPTSASALSLWLQKCSESDLSGFLTAYAHFLPLSLPAPGALAPALPQEGTPQKNGPTATTDNTNADPDEKTENSTAPPESFIGWLIQRANYGGHLSHFGVQGRWEKQTPEELQHVCKGIIEAADSDNLIEAKYALFACLSLASALPGNLLLHVTLTKNADIWFNPETVSIHWCLLRLLNNDLAKKIDIQDICPTNIIDIWLPACITHTCWLLASLHSNCNTVAEFVTGSTEVDVHRAFLVGYRKWLSSLGPESLHRTYDARIARSVGQMYRLRSNDIVAAIAGLDFEECGMGMLHYVQLAKTFLYHQTTAVYQTLGLGAPVTPASLTGSVGSTSAMQWDDFIKGLCELARHRVDLLDEMQRAADIQLCCDVFNKLVECDQLLELSLSGGRASHFERQTWGQLQAHPNYILKADKDLDEYTKARVIPAHRALRQLLDLHYEAALLFTTCIERLGGIARSPRGRVFCDRTPHRVYFARAKTIERDGKIYLFRSPVRAANLKDLCTRFLNGEVNVGRHSLLSAAVLTSVDPWFWKCLSGHHRGFAEPFSDGMAEAPATALEKLAEVLNSMFAPLANVLPDPSTHAVLLLPEFTGRLPDPSTHSSQDGSYARVLPPPFDGYTLLSLRVIPHLAALLDSGCGPSHPGAAFLLNLMLNNWINIPDCKTLWKTATPFQRVSNACASSTWKRTDCNSEIRVPMDPASLLALSDLKKSGTQNWIVDVEAAASWLRFTLLNLSWASGNSAALEQLDCLLARWLRFHIPPFAMAAMSPSLAPPTASSATLATLLELDAPSKAMIDEVLVFPKPKPRGTANRKPGNSAFQQIVGLVHEYADPAKHRGEEWQRMKGLSAACASVDRSEDISAQAILDVVEAEAKLWSTPARGPRQASTLSTYLYLLSPLTSQILPVHNLMSWEDEWQIAIDFLQSAHAPEGESPGVSVDRLTAFRWFMGSLYQLGYPVPPHLLDGLPKPEKKPGQRISAAATLITTASQDRVKRLMVSHFEYDPLYSKLAGLYVDLRFAVGLRSTECSVLPLNAIDDFGRLIVTTDGFSHLKSENARRMVPLSKELTAEISRLREVILASHPRAQWLFLLDDRTDWRYPVQLELAFSAALKQVTGDDAARPHSARAVRALEIVLPDWEVYVSKLLAGNLNATDLQRLHAHLTACDIAFMAKVLLVLGHGHPRTYLNYYFSLGDLLYGLLCHCWHLAHTDVLALIKSKRPEYRAAFMKAQTRAGKTFNPVQWLIKRELQDSALSYLPSPEQHAAVSPVRQSTPAVKVISVADKTLYLAARMCGQPWQAAAHDFGVDQATAATLESLLAGAGTRGLVQRHQAKPSLRGLKAEIKYLQSESGHRLATSLQGIQNSALRIFSEDLTPRRTYMAASPGVDALAKRLIGHLALLPAELGLQVQFSPNRYASEDLLRLASASPRLHVGPADPDLGGRPRLSVVEASAPGNLVLKARRTSTTRCVLAAYFLLTN